MAKLIQIAQQVADLYFQNFPSNDSFLDIEDFKAQVANTYSAMLDALFQAERKGKKAEDGFSNVEIPVQWTISEKLTIEHEEDCNKFFVTTTQPVFAFTFDGIVYALQPLIGIGNHCNNKPCKYRRITLYEVQFLEVSPPVGIVFYYLNSANEIVFLGAKKEAQVSVQYIPQIIGQDDDCLLSDNIVSILTDTVLERMFKAKNGNFVDKVNDQNPNVIPGQQVNPLLGK